MSRPVIYGGAIRNRGARDGGAERARGRADLGGRGSLLEVGQTAILVAHFVIEALEAAAGEVVNGVGEALGGREARESSDDQGFELHDNIDAGFRVCQFIMMAARYLGRKIVVSSKNYGGDAGLEGSPKS
ncbi:hypothetical protein E8E14_000310 [Neopestalotiopsis sp. 37M]|nr:hypothetical protein E8E14_000310 [Neopestalotiopsis sp. 37M]